MAAPYHLGFASQTREVSLDTIPVLGTLPSWLRGTLLRNGPAQFEVGSRRLRHWFDGLAMLHKFTFHDGGVAYANKFIRSPEYVVAEREGRLAYPEFATDPCRSIWKRVTTLFWPELGHNANISISKIADRFVAWTETPLPIEFDPESLRTVGVVPFADQLDLHTTTPHPHIDPRSGDALNASLRFGPTSSYNIYGIPAGQEQRHLIASLPVREPAYMHSFSMTASYVVLAEYPLVVNPLRMLLNGKPFAENLEWRAERPTQFLIISRDSGRLVRRVAADAFFCFHHVNAWEHDGSLTLDLLAYPDADVIRRLYLDVLRNPTIVTPQPPAELRRYTLPLDNGQASYEVVSPELMELPRINYERCHTQPYRYVYGVGLRAGHPLDFSNQLVKTDTQQRTSQTWFAPDCYPGEPVFVATPGARDEDDGLILSVVLDARRGSSFLLILDAGDFTERARAEAPHHIPFGFHGAYFAD